MAKKSIVLVRLLSSASGFFYVRKKNPKKLLKKLSFRKFDKYQGKHVLFEEAKIK